MKIAFYINAIHEGGAERVMVNLAKQFSEHGYDALMITSFVSPWEYGLGENVRRITLFRELNQGFLTKNIKLVRALRRVIKEEQPDVVISFMAEPNFRMLWACRKKKIKKIISIRNDPEKEYPNLVYRVLAKHLYKKADRIIFQTEEAQKWFPKKIQEKSCILLNQVDEVFFNIKHQGVRHDIVATGRLVKQKNHTLLIRAFARISDQIEDNLYIYGEGELRRDLEQLISNLGLTRRIFLPGQIDNVAETLKSAKLYVLSSDYEGMPNALMEAMAMGLPCISTDCPCGGPHMIIDNGFDGILVPVGDIKSLSESLVLLSKDKELNKSLSVNAKEKARLLFGKDKIYNEWRDYIENGR